jgi:tetratricopeptide (TPR) repeat protein
MIRNKHILSVLASGLLLVSSLSGCKAWNNFRAEVPDVKPMRMKRAKEAISEFEQHRNEAQYQAALSAFRQGNLAGCKDLLTPLVARSPDHRAARLLMVELCMTRNDLVGATEHIEIAAEKFPKDAEVAYFRGQVFDLAGDDAQALQAYQLAVELDPNNATYSASYETAVDLEIQTDESQATINVSANEQLSDVERNDAVCFALLQAQLWIALREPRLARSVLKDILAEEPDQEAANQMLAQLDSPPSKRSHSPARNNRRPAIDRNVRQASHSKPKDPETNRQSDTSRSVENDPVSLRLGGKSDARQAKADPATGDVSADEWLRRGTAALAAGAPDGASRFLRRAIENKDSQEEIAQSAAVAALRNDQPALSAELAEAGLQRFPKSAALYRVLGAAQYRRGEWVAAQVALQQALSLDNTQALSYFLMGSTLTKLGRSEEAQSYYRQARQLDARYAVEP